MALVGVTDIFRASGMVVFERGLARVVGHEVSGCQAAAAAPRRGELERVRSARVTAAKTARWSHAPNDRLFYDLTCGSGNIGGTRRPGDP
jgi:hypothetical protein